VTPNSANRAFIFGSARTTLIALLSLSMISIAVFLARVDASPPACLVARDEITHGLDVRQTVETHLLAVLAGMARKSCLISCSHSAPEGGRGALVGRQGDSRGMSMGDTLRLQAGRGTHGCRASSQQPVNAW
jgi:hypothetical protein